MKTIIAANWKMNKTVSESVSFIRQFKVLVKDVKDIEIIICPPYTALASLASESDHIAIGAQNMYFESKGAFTGEISAEMIKDIGCKYVIIGHSERRHIFGEKDESINRKVKAALEKSLIPILCVGELLEERENDKTEHIIRNQLEKGLKGVDVDKIMLAYEPVWAIGTGKTASPEQAEEVHKLIRGIVGPDVPILYGGSVKPDNVKQLMSQENVNGALVGGASLDAKEFSELIINAR